MSKSYRYTPDQEQQSRQANKAKKLSQQQAGRVEKLALRKGE